ncbi:P-II family nitrogen regulator [Aliifodinibius sp. S!AR15-10]|uniref:P-II family nitrogen regulator n=1 Tax=Aliifodinibius sp. S!AR15-10 TaxID=2950437 RepID=UPI002860F0FD|nr:P-II family nitrogen regulator [Aliifodinibius sp. S!AR15-10]MDR8391429.1 P-II family nitrogen regulator [Aliifodinibius sp. S!AR15-10]
MNEIKAFIRKRKAEEVIDGLEAQGFCCMTLMDVMGLGRMSDPQKAQLSISIAERFSNIIKLVVVCEEKHTDQVIDIIRNHARSGQPGDGIIYVTPVSQSVHIRSGKTGGDFLQSERHTH